MGKTAETRARTWSKNTAFLLLCVAQLMVLLDASIVQIALPSIQREFGAASGTLQWITTAYTLCFGGFLLVGSRLGDRIGRRRTLAAGVWLFTLASAAAGFAPASGMLIAARALQGLNAAVIAPMVFVFVAALFAEGPARNRAMGILSSVSAAGFVTGLILGGTLTGWFGWRSVFFLTVLAGLLVAAALPILPADRAGGRRPLDLAGAMTATLGIGCLVLALTEGGAFRNASWTGVLFAVSLLLLGLFVLIERSSPHPLLPLNLLAGRAFSGAAVAAFLFGSVIGPSIFMLTLYMQQAMAFEPLRAAAAFLPQELTVILAANLAGRCVTRFGTRPVLLAGAAAFALGSWRLSQLEAQDAYLAHILPGTVLIGIGVGCIMVGSSVAMTNGLAREDHGAAAGLWNVAPQIGASVSLAMLVSAADWFSHGQLLLAPRSPEALAGYRAAFVALLVYTAVIGSGIGLLLRRPAPVRRERSPDPKETEGADIR
jgi:EmrB/QacA subfamily drug resistance transporter